MHKRTNYKIVTLTNLNKYLQCGTSETEVCLYIYIYIYIYISANNDSEKHIILITMK